MEMTRKVHIILKQFTAVHISEFCFLHGSQASSRVPTPPGKSGIFFLKIPGPGKPGKSLWSWKVLKIKA